MNEVAAARSVQLGWKWKFLVMRAQGAVLGAFFASFVRFFEGLASSDTAAPGASAGAPSVAAALEAGGEVAEGGGAAEGALALSTLRPASTAQTPKQQLAAAMGQMLPKLRATSVSIARWAQERMERRVHRGEGAWRHAASEELGAHQASLPLMSIDEH